MKKQKVKNNGIFKPPLGIEPAYLYYDKRHEDVKAAIIRYIDHGYCIPPKWVEEHNMICKLINEPIKSWEIDGTIRN